MTPVNWTPEARSRLEDIEAYIAKDSPAAAQEMVQRILARTRQLEIAPRSGRPVPDYQQEDLRELLGRYHELCSETIARYDGHVAQYLGDGLLVYFGYPQAHEDDGERAARCTAPDARRSSDRAR